MIDTISLDTTWRCDTLEGDPDERIAGFDVPSLVRFDVGRLARKTAWLERRFDLPTQDICINYQLKIEAVPGETRLYINGRDFGVISGPLQLDVTDTVALEDNLIAFRIGDNDGRRFGSVRLIALPCE